MNATITFKVAKMPHPWDEKLRAKGETAWCLMKVVTPELGTGKTEEAIALFNWDSDAEIFMAHIFASGLEGKLISIDREMKELLEYLQSRKPLI